MGDFQHVASWVFKAFSPLLVGPLRSFIFVPVAESHRNKRAGVEGNLDTLAELEQTWLSCVRCSPSSGNLVRWLVDGSASSYV